MEAQRFDTPRGLARAYVTSAPGPRAALLLGHGAGGSVTAPDLLAVRDAAVRAHVSVVLVEQPYRVAGRRAAAPAAQLDEAWISVVGQLRAGELLGLPVLVGGRSSGARVACRTAGATDAIGVICLAFPLQPPTRGTSVTPPSSRLPELDRVRVETLIVQGTRDPFGMPPAAARRTVVAIAGDHRLRSDLPALVGAVETWLGRVLAGA